MIIKAKSISKLIESGKLRVGSYVGYDIVGIIRPAIYCKKELFGLHHSQNGWILLW